MNHFRRLVLLGLSLTVAGVHAGDTNISVQLENAAFSATKHAHVADIAHTPARSQIDDALSDLDLLQPDLDPNSSIALLDEMLPGWSASLKGGPGAVGYVPHRKWGLDGENGFGRDRFAGSLNGNYNARAAARLSNGDIVVVGDVQGTGMGTGRQLGIVKYNSRGQRVVWTNVPGDFGHFSNQYIVFPSTSGWDTNPQRTIVGVHDVAVRGSAFYVLITYGEDGRRRPAILQWNENGSGYTWWFSWPDSGTIRDGVALDILGNQMVMVGRRSVEENSFTGGFWTTRYTINGDGSLSVGAINSYMVDYRHIPTDIAFRRNTALIPAGAQPYYVSTTRTVSAPGGGLSRSACLFSINANDTQNDSSLCYTMGNDIASDQNWAAGVHTHARSIVTIGGVVTQEVRYMSLAFQRGRADGIGVIKWIDGVLDTSFGPNGRRAYGGCDNSGNGEGCFNSLPLPDIAHVPLAGAIFADNNSVYIAGRTFRPGIIAGSAPTRRPIFLQASGTNGSLTSLQTFGSYPNSRFSAFVPGTVGANGVREFTAVGYAHDEDTVNISSGPTQIITTHLVRDGDLIFYDGLQP